MNLKDNILEAENLYRKGIIEEDKDKYFKSIELLENMISNNKDDIENLYYLYYLMGLNYTELISYYIIVENEWLTRKRLLTKGVKAANKAINLNKNFAPGYALKANLLGKRLAIYGFQFAPVIGPIIQKLMHQAMKIDPEDEYVQLERARGHYYNPPIFGGGIKKAMSGLQKILEKNDKCDEAHLYLAMCYQKKKLIDESIESYNKVLTIRKKCTAAENELEKLLKRKKKG